MHFVMREVTRGFTHKPCCNSQPHLPFSNGAFSWKVWDLPQHVVNSEKLHAAGAGRYMNVSQFQKDYRKHQSYWYYSDLKGFTATQPATFNWSAEWFCTKSGLQFCSFCKWNIQIAVKTHHEIYVTIANLIKNKQRPRSRLWNSIASEYPLHWGGRASWYAILACSLTNHSKQITGASRARSLTSEWIDLGPKTTSCSNCTGRGATPRKRIPWCLL